MKIIKGVLGIIVNNIGWILLWYFCTTGLYLFTKNKTILDYILSGIIVLIVLVTIFSKRDPEPKGMRL